MRVLPRSVEAAVGGKLLKFISRKLLKRAGMIKKEVVVSSAAAAAAGLSATKKQGDREPEPLTIHYYERPGTGPTLLLCHGITDEARNMAAFVGLIQKKLPHWRMIVPDLIGHGHDLDRARKVGTANFDYPTPQRLLQSMEEFLTALEIKECYAFGMSLGGAMAYFLQHAHPDVIRKTVIINPALDFVVNEEFIDDFKQGRKNHFCVESRADVKQCFRDLSCPHRKKKDPVPKFLLEAIWQDRLAREPPQHFRTLSLRLIEERGKDPQGTYFSSPHDIAPDLPRLVIWPEHDYIADHAKGKAFFAKSTNTTFHSIPDCGHLFHSDGKNILEYAAPILTDYLKDE
jgi:pimeloyl-ACP methyl ester carboxylesterase